MADFKLFNGKSWELLATQTWVEGKGYITPTTGSEYYPKYIQTRHQNKTGWYGTQYPIYAWWETGSICKWVVDNYETKVDRAVKDADGNNIASTYLPKSGGTITGILSVDGTITTKGIYAKDNNMGGIGSSTNRFQYMYVTELYGSDGICKNVSDIALKSDIPTSDSGGSFNGGDITNDLNIKDGKSLNVYDPFGYEVVSINSAWGIEMSDNYRLYIGEPNDTTTIRLGSDGLVNGSHNGFKFDVDGGISVSINSNTILFPEKSGTLATLDDVLLPTDPTFNSVTVSNLVDCRELQVSYDSENNIGTKIRQTDISIKDTSTEVYIDQDSLVITDSQSGCGISVNTQNLGLEIYSEDASTKYGNGHIINNINNIDGGGYTIYLPEKSGKLATLGDLLEGTLQNICVQNDRYHIYMSTADGGFYIYDKTEDIETIYNSGYIIDNGNIINLPNKSGTLATLDDIQEGGTKVQIITWEDDD